MCKEDIRLARAARPGLQASATPTAAGVKLLGANSERFAVFAGLQTGVDFTAHWSVLIYARAGAAVYPLMGISADQPAAMLSLAEAGDIICEEIWAMKLEAAVAPAIYVSETKWDQPQERI